MTVLLVIDLPDERVGNFPRRAKVDHLHAWYGTLAEAEVARIALSARFGDRDHRIVQTDHCPSCGATLDNRGG